MSGKCLAKGVLSLNTCLKCGRETPEKYTYCAHCLEVMEQYPVKPGTMIHLPRRNTAQLAKKPVRRKAPTPEEQVISLRKTIRVLVVCLLLTIGALGYFVWQFFANDSSDQVPTENPIGQNYTIDITENETSHTP